MSQGMLFGAGYVNSYVPPAVAKPQPPKVDPIAVEGKRLSRQCQAILERLQAGRASNSELAGIALNYRARISDLRAVGHTVVCVDRNRETGLSFYEIQR